MTKIPFKVSSRTARLIGRENVSNAEGALIELVKNAHDADATHAFIIFHEQDLFIIDNGSGMTSDVIENAWMTIGTDNKEVNPYTEKKRVKTGAKGIGRFAMDRLGGGAVMHTVPEGSKDGFQWEVEWESFEVSSKSIGEITAEYDKVTDLKLASVLPEQYRKDVGDALSKHGTVIRISRLRDDWTQDDITKLYENLETLVPNTEQDEFTIGLFASEFPGKFGEVSPITEDDFDSKMFATYDSKTNKVRATIYRNELDVAALSKKYSAVFNNPAMKDFPYDLKTFQKGSFTKEYSLYEMIPGLKSHSKDVEKLGDFSMTIIFMKIQPGGEPQKFPYKSFDYARRKEWLSRFGGIKVFRDNFRVRPYGETGDDWLRLGERKARSPGGAGQAPTGFRFGPNQLSGGINISRIKNLQLEDKSSREGIKENDTFRLFKNVVLEIIALLEEDRNHTFYPLAELYKVENENESKKQRGKEVADRLNKKSASTDSQPAASSANAASDAQDLAAAYAVQEEEIEDKNEEIKILRSLASAGLITAAAAHELRALENNLSTRTKDLRDLLQPLIKDEQLKLLKEEQNPFILLDDMEKTDYSIKEWLNYALMPLKRDRRKLSSIYLNDYFDGLKQNWSNLLKERRITLNIQSEDDALVRLFPIDLDTIFNNLIINSVESFARKKNRDSRNIEIICKSLQKNYLITYEDNGAGLDEGFKANPGQIFLPQKTTKRDSTGKAIGTGMGMYLVKSIVDESKGVIEIIENPDGFTLKIELPRGAKA